MEKIDEEILTKMPKSWLLIRNIWLKGTGSSTPAKSRGDKR